MTWDGYIEPASIDQYREGKNGKVHLITSDAGGVADGLRQIDKGLKLRYSEGGKYYAVTHVENGIESLVKTYQECDQRIVKDIARIQKQNVDPNYSFADELDRMDREADKKRDQEFSEQIGEAGERLHHAMNKDLGVKPKIFIPGQKENE